MCAWPILAQDNTHLTVTEVFFYITTLDFFQSHLSVCVKLCVYVKIISKFLIVVYHNLSGTQLGIRLHKLCKILYLFLHISIYFLNIFT